MWFGGGKLIFPSGAEVEWRLCGMWGSDLSPRRPPSTDEIAVLRAMIILPLWWLVTWLRRRGTALLFISFKIRRLCR